MVEVSITRDGVISGFSNSDLGLFAYRHHHFFGRNPSALRRCPPRRAQKGQLKQVQALSVIMSIKGRHSLERAAYQWSCLGQWSWVKATKP